jgi:hypothetical protein
MNNQNANINLTIASNEQVEILLREKERKLTDIRLEQMATAQQLDVTKEENLKMKVEIEHLKTENIKMQHFLNQQKQIQQQQSQQIQSNTIVPPCSLVSSPSPTSSISSTSNNSKINLSLSNSIQNVDYVANNSSSSSSSSSSVSCSILTNTLKLNANFLNEEKLKSPLEECPNKIILNEPNINDGKRVVVSIYVGDLNPLDDLIDDVSLIYY